MATSSSRISTVRSWSCWSAIFAKLYFAMTEPDLVRGQCKNLLKMSSRENLSEFVSVGRQQKLIFISFRSLHSLHCRSFVHADLKPANLMWSVNDGCFKLLDFGLTFHTNEKDLHQVQTKGSKKDKLWICVARSANRSSHICRLSSSGGRRVEFLQG